MTPIQFAYWLIGGLEQASAAGCPFQMINESHGELIKKHLALVFATQNHDPPEVQAFCLFLRTFLDHMRLLDSEGKKVAFTLMQLQLNALFKHVVDDLNPALNGEDLNSIHGSGSMRC